MPVQRTSGASETIFMNRSVRSSRVTGPKMRVPIGSSLLLSNTAALPSNLIRDPSERRTPLAVRTTTALQQPGAAYTLADDEPAPAELVMEWAARRMGLDLPPEVDWTDPAVSDAMRRFYLDSKRLSNARAKAALGWRLKYPTYREGLESLLAH